MHRNNEWHSKNLFFFIETMGRRMMIRTKKNFTSETLKAFIESIEDKEL